MDTLNKLNELFERFPGVGPRQAKRFTYFLLRQPSSFLSELADAIRDSKRNIRLCKMSYCYFYSADPSVELSPIARDPTRDKSRLMIVEKDSDMENLERTGLYNGHYFVLGGTVPLLEKSPEKRIRLAELKEVVTKRIEDGLEEIILATSANPEGDHTGEIVEKTLHSFDVKISHLGRGISTGTELEYIDAATLESALKNRS